MTIATTDLRARHPARPLWAQRSAGHLLPRPVLELSNVANLPIAIYPEMKIGQISFYQLSTPAENPYGSSATGSKYQGQQGPTPSRVHKDF